MRPMTRPRRALLPLLLAALLLIGCARDEQLTEDEARDEADPTSSTQVPNSTPTSASGSDTDFAAMFRAELTGTAEPSPGDADAYGQARVGIRPSMAEICAQIAVGRIAEASAAHVHRGDAGAEGPVVAELTPPNPASEGCAPISAELGEEIASNPAGFYLDVHTGDFPDGAVRGQLEPD